jgi:hypothetical protein
MTLNGVDNDLQIQNVSITVSEEGPIVYLYLMYVIRSDIPFYVNMRK